MDGESETIKAQFGEVLLYDRDEIDDDCFESMVNSMPKRVKAVLDSNEWYTKY